MADTLGLTAPTYRDPYTLLAFTACVKRSIYTTRMYVTCLRAVITGSVDSAPVNTAARVSRALLSVFAGRGPRYIVVCTDPYLINAKGGCVSVFGLYCNFQTGFMFITHS